MLKDVPVEAIQPGDKVWAYGIRFMVKRNEYDAIGNVAGGVKPRRPRHVLVCDADAGQHVPAIYRKDMTLGRIVGELMTVEA